MPIRRCNVVVAISGTVISVISIMAGIYFIRERFLIAGITSLAGGLLCLGAFTYGLIIGAWT